MAAYSNGFDAGYSGEPENAPSGLAMKERHAWYHGFEEGQKYRQDELLDEEDDIMETD